MGFAAPVRAGTCRSRHFETGWYRRWARRIAAGDPDLHRFGPEFAAAFARVWEAMQFDGRAPRFRHRKMWEWCAIAEVLDARGKLAPGQRGCGFAVGHEPLASLFAAQGAEVLATDLAAAEGDAWAASGQQSHSLESLHWPTLIDWPTFRARAAFRAVDMRDLAPLAGEHFDFVWSSCSLEHLGDLEAGLAFVEHAAELLRPGGVAVHTTEFNLSSATDTVERGDAVIYRARDILGLGERLARRGMVLEPPDFAPGRDAADRDCDEPPYYVSGRQHVTLRLAEFVATSILLIVERP
jgi:SAM-dependent methyltransferase